MIFVCTGMPIRKGREDEAKEREGKGRETECKNE